MKLINITIAVHELYGACTAICRSWIIHESVHELVNKSFMTFSQGNIDSDQSGGHLQAILFFMCFVRDENSKTSSNTVKYTRYNLGTEHLVVLSPLLGQI